jgi:hypothetical protein
MKQFIVQSELPNRSDSNYSKFLFSCFIVYHFQNYRRDPQKFLNEKSEQNLGTNFL